MPTMRRSRQSSRRRWNFGGHIEITISDMTPHGGESYRNHGGPTVGQYIVRCSTRRAGI
jgi:hypothetical protein